MDAVELLLGDAPFIADTSAWWRFSSLPAELAGLIKEAADERLWTTPIVRMEILYSARSTSEYIELETELDALRILRSDHAVTDAAMSAIGEMAERSDGYHRGAADRRPNRCRPPLNTAALRCFIATLTSTSSPKSSPSRTSSFREPDLRPERASGGRDETRGPDHPRVRRLEARQPDRPRAHQLRSFCSFNDPTAIRG